MEKSPLTLAHTHARNALQETRKSNAVAASEEHDLAAGEFANAAQTTTDLEARRILQLLEQHHKSLAQILKFRHEHPEATAAAATAAEEIATTSTNAARPAQADVTATATLKPSTATDTPPHVPRLPSQQRGLQRESSSSIASKLASARGIPSDPQRRGAPVSPTLSAQHAGGRMLGQAASTTGRNTQDRRQRSPEAAQTRPSSTRHSRAPPSLFKADETDQYAPVQASNADTIRPSDDEMFNRFYNTFGGLISKISAPLAFAGLPITGTNTTQQQARTPEPTHDKRHPRRTPMQQPQQPQSSDPDLHRLISRSALRAIKKTGDLPNTAESFYVVPQTGGMLSYRDILSRAERESHQPDEPPKTPTLRQKGSSPYTSATRSTTGTELDEDEDDDFVDARSSPSHSSPELITRLGAAAHNSSSKTTYPLPRTHSKTQTTTSTSTTNATASSSRRQQSNNTTTPPSTKTFEELQMENQALKHLSDTLSKRLHMWEVNAQNGSAALQMSLRALQSGGPSLPNSVQNPPSPGLKPTTTQPTPYNQTHSPSPQVNASSTTTTTAAAAAEQELVTLKAEIEAQKADLERAGRENEKLRGVVGRYRERWEKLKEGARVRREGGGGAGGGGNGTAATAGDAMPADGEGTVAGGRENGDREGEV